MKRRPLLSRLLTFFSAPATATDRHIAIRGTMTFDSPLALGVDVIDTDTGKPVKMVRAVNVEEGWVEVYKTDRKGRLKLKAPGNIVGWETRDGKNFPVYPSGWDEPIVECRRGAFDLRRKLPV